MDGGGERLISLQFAWGNERKDVSSIWLGTSPEFELALYTLCFVAGAEENLVTLAGYEVKIRWNPISQGPCCSCAAVAHALRALETCSSSSRVYPKPPRQHLLTMRPACAGATTFTASTATKCAPASPRSAPLLPCSVWDTSCGAASVPLTAREGGRACALTVWAYLGCAAAVKAAGIPPACAICAACAALAAGNACDAAPGLGAAPRAAVPAATAGEPAAQCVLIPYHLEHIVQPAWLDKIVTL